VRYVKIKLCSLCRRTHRFFKSVPLRTTGTCVPRDIQLIVFTVIKIEIFVPGYFIFPRSRPHHLALARRDLQQGHVKSRTIFHLNFLSAPFFPVSHGIVITSTPRECDLLYDYARRNDDITSRTKEGREGYLYKYSRSPREESSHPEELLFACDVVNSKFSTTFTSRWLL